MKSSKHTRRTFLQMSLVGTASFGAGILSASTLSGFRPSHTYDFPKMPNLGLSFQSPKLEPFVDALPIPPIRKLGGTVKIAEALHQFHRDLPSAPSWGYDGMTHLGPTFNAHVNDDIVTNFSNELKQHILADDIDADVHGASESDRSKPQTVVHLHGAPNRPVDDGHPFAMFYPGMSQDYRFRHPEQAAQLWYHDHAMGTTRLSVYAGLAGSYFVRDNFDTGKTDNPLGLPAEKYEIPLIICDKLLKSDGSLRYQGTPLNPQDVWAGGLCGDVIVVNGKVWPYLEVDRGVYRFRVVNGTQLNDYRLELSNGAAFWVIGSDGGLLDEPVLVNELDIGCGERYDVLIDFSKMKAGEHVDLKNSSRISWPGQLVGAVTVRDVMRFKVMEQQGNVLEIPKTLRGGVGQPAKLPALLTTKKNSENIRTATLNAAINVKKIRWVATGMMNINNMGFMDEDFDKPVQGTTEIWEFVNCDLLRQLHTMHVHLIQFRVINRQSFDLLKYIAEGERPALGNRWAPPVKNYLQGEPLDIAPYETGWKDTVRCPPAQVTRVEVKWPTKEELGFDPDAPFLNAQGKQIQGYVWHCHLLDHEDHEMMQRLRIVAADNLINNNGVEGYKNAIDALDSGHH